MKRILFIAVLALASMSAIAKDIHTIVLTPNPGLRCHNCEAKVTEQLRYVKGVKRIAASAETQTITVTIDLDKSGVQVLLDNLKKIGYDATVASDTPATRADMPVQPKPKAQKMKKGAATTCTEGGSCCEK
ncbi:MAG: heavy-metal-associated domain-containing protein [Bacteroidales bacterium]|nr:heavy-metal-associated domain-containing protein [Bacteroidales bacterium]